MSKLNIDQPDAKDDFTEADIKARNTAILNAFLEFFVQTIWLKCKAKI